MGVKTYLPKLQFIARMLCRYIQRYEMTIKDNLPSESRVLVDNVLLACQALEVVLDEQITTGP